ncbi:hypothetical protein [Sphingomonas sp. Leaf30]|uniref:hypothetical protein n=1 Tax=Sphingomonas sp. Leaf30 TaxID=1736213 RepID=UPI0006F311E5|nr:hypothetical protein [Sphingomonas sp. Leaf30]KQN14092.1 hypothetical protein ASE89_10055 [Sphingomonas sp. Leaf30]
MTEIDRRDGDLPLLGGIHGGGDQLRLLLPFEAGFVINPEKAHYADRNARRTVTGLRVNEALNVDRRFVRNLRAALRSVEVLGEMAAEAKFHAEHGGSAAIGSHFQGKLSWLGHGKGPSDPVFRGMASRFNRSFPTLALEIQPTRSEVRERAVWLIEHWEGTGDQGTAFFMALACHGQSLRFTVGRG